VEAGELDSVLNSLSAAEGVEELVEARGRDGLKDLAELRAGLGGERRGHEGQLGGLVLDGLDHLLVVVADVGAHELRVEVGVTLAVGVPEVDAVSAIRSGVSGVQSGTRVGF